MGWPEPNAMTMADEAVQLATGSMDFAPYDNDGNGYVCSVAKFESLGTNYCRLMLSSLSMLVAMPPKPAAKTISGV